MEGKESWVKRQAGRARSMFHKSQDSVENGSEGASLSSEQEANLLCHKSRGIGTYSAAEKKPLQQPGLVTKSYGSI